MRRRRSRRLVYSMLIDIITGEATENKRKFIEKLYGGESIAVISACSASEAIGFVCDLNGVNKTALNLAAGVDTREVIKAVRARLDLKIELLIAYIESGAPLSGERLINATGEADAVVLDGFCETARKAAVEKIKETNPRVTVVIGEEIKNGKTLLDNLIDGKRILNLFSGDIKNLFDRKR